MDSLTVHNAHLQVVQYIADGFLPRNRKQTDYTHYIAPVDIGKIFVLPCAGYLAQLGSGKYRIPKVINCVRYLQNIKRVQFCAVFIFVYFSDLNRAIES